MNQSLLKIPVTRSCRLSSIMQAKAQIKREARTIPAKNEKTLCMILSISFIFLFVNSAFSEDRTTFLIDRLVTPDSQINALKDFGYKKHSQPVFMTDFLLAINTNYASISITTTTSAENAVLHGLLASEKVKLLQKVTVKGGYDSRTGGNVTWTEVEDCKTNPDRYVCYPPDWNRDWTEVKISSP